MKRSYGSFPLPSAGLGIFHRNCTATLVHLKMPWTGLVEFGNFVNLWINFFPADSALFIYFLSSWCKIRLVNGLSSTCVHVKLSNVWWIYRYVACIYGIQKLRIDLLGYTLGNGYKIYAWLRNSHFHRAVPRYRAGYCCVTTSAAFTAFVTLGSAKKTANMQKKNGNFGLLKLIGGALFSGLQF